VLHAAIFAGAAWALPWRHGDLFMLTSAGMAALHLGVVVAAFGPTTWQRAIWRSTAWASVAYLLGWGWAVASSGQYLAGLYGSLGTGVGLALAAAFAPVVTLTLPYALWGLTATRHEHMRSREKALALLFAATAASTWTARGSTRVRPRMAMGDVSALLDAVADLRAQTTSDAAQGRRGSGPVRAATRPAQCQELAFDSGQLVALIAIGDGPVACVTAPDPEALTRQVLARVDGAADVVAVDIVTGVAPLRPPNGVVEALALRPGLDGVCAGGRCLAPRQLVAGEHLNSTRPVPFIRDLRVGIDTHELREVLGVDDAAQLWRIESEAWVIDARGSKHPLRRPGAAVQLTRQALETALSAAQSHVIAAQRENGEFRYKLHAVTGQTAPGRSIPRQAGTLMVLCQLADDSGAARRTIERGVEALLGLVVEEAEVGFVVRDPNTEIVALGPTALASVALQRCKARIDETMVSRVDEAVRRFGAFILSMQRENGAFAARWDRARVEPKPGPQVLYAAGQATLALALQATQGDQGVQDALARHVDWVARRYWGHPTAGLFFLEENWYCLAADQLLQSSQRHDGFERFCLDYVEYKRRLLLRETDGVSPDLVGGYGFGNLIPPHVTATAGFAEALAAAVDVADARGERRRAGALREDLATVLGHLLSHQWDATRCHACRRPDLTVGGFAESAASVVMRIDFTQHAWAALGHGGRALGLLRAPVDAGLSASRSAQ
jgi:hypothetical protein